MTTEAEHIDPADYECILEGAMRRYKEWNRRGGVRGRAVRIQDGIDYWVAVECFARSKAYYEPKIGMGILGVEPPRGGGVPLAGRAG